MRAIILALAALLLLAACNSSNETVATDAPAAAATGAAAVTICPQIGDGSTPTTPTPVPSCAPGNLTGPDLSHISLQESQAPSLPSGRSAASPYYIVSGAGVGFSATLSIVLLPGQLNGRRLAFYTQTDAGWQRAGDVTVLAPGENSNASAIGSFDRVPENLIVLAEPTQ